MKHALNLMLGTVGTVFSVIESDKFAAAFAGLATGVWMIYQLATAIYDRARRAKAVPVPSDDDKTG